MAGLDALRRELAAQLAGGHDAAHDDRGEPQPGEEPVGVAAGGRHVGHDELAAGALGGGQHRGDQGLGHPVPAGVGADPELLDGQLGLGAEPERVLGGDGVADGLAVEAGHEGLHARAGTARWTAARR